MPNMASSHPLVSVLVPCFNAAPWLRQCLESCLSQTYPNVEVLVIDDGSTDHSVGILREYSDRIQFKSVPNGGACAARNLLLQWARGEWVQYLDADDYLLDHKIEMQVSAVRNSADAVDIVYSPLLILNENDENPTLAPVKVDPNGDPFYHYFCWGPFSSTGILCRRSVLLQIGGWKDDQPCCQEHEMILRLLIGGFRFQFVDQAAVVYRFHAVESISRKDPLRTMQFRASFCDELQQYLQNQDAYTDRHAVAQASGRIGMARSAFPHDPVFACRLAEQATRGGFLNIPPTPATALLYRMVYRLIGFQRTEKLAAFIRQSRAVAKVHFSRSIQDANH